MTAVARVKVRKAPALFRVLGFRPWLWVCLADSCTDDDFDGEGGDQWSWGAALEAGYKHLRRVHPEVVWAAGGSVYRETYCRTHGVPRAECSPVHAERAVVPEAAAQRCEHCWHPVADHYGRWCRHVTGAIKANRAKRICCCEGADSADVTVSAAFDQFEAEHPEPTYCRTHGCHVSACEPPHDGTGRPERAESRLERDLDPSTDAFEPCGLGVCAANAGHAGTCAQASGWDDDCDICDGSGIYPNVVPGVGTEYLTCPQCDHDADPIQRAHRANGARA